MEQDGTVPERNSGKSMRRVEAPRFITGQGQYLADLHIDNVADVALVRSPFAHARISEIDIERTRALPGVVAVLTGDDLSHLGSVPVQAKLNVPAHPPLARGTVKFVGDPVVAIVAENRSIAEDALETVHIEYEPLPAIVTPQEALAPDAVLVHAEFDSNLVMSAEIDTGDVEREFERADRRLQVHVGHGRVAALPIETRGGIAAYDPETDHYTLWLSTQAAWLERPDVANALGVPEDHVRVITPDVGGAFGGKMTAYREDILLLGLARIVGRPVRWIASRTEDLQASMHGREAYTDGEVAFDTDGRIRALRLKTVANLGSYLMKNSGGPPMRMLLFPTGAYTIRHLQSEVTGVFTNTGPMGPYRGAGRPEASYFIERVVSDVAHALGMDQAEIRRKNFIPSDSFPYTNASNVTYDSGDYELALDRALANIDIERVRDDIAERRAQGEIVGLGIASCVEVSGGGAESGSMLLHKDGRVTAITGSSPHGQGLETSFAQIVSDVLSVPMDDIRITHGDTSAGLPGRGTMGSRSLQLGGSALREAAQEVRRTLLQTASDLLEVAQDDLIIENGSIAPTGVPERSVSIGDVVQHFVDKRQGPDPRGNDENDGIASEVSYQAAGESFPFGTTIVLISIDRDTGHPTIERFVSVDDVGNVVNPVLVEGQLIGGSVQGISETLWEQVIYDESGQLVTGTLMDYTAPKASQVPHFELDRTETPSPNNPLGAKGAGEAGTVHAPPAVTNAIMDALRPFGAESFDLPITGEMIWRVINAGS